MRRRLLALLAAAALQGCTLPAALPEATEVRGNGADVVVIGKIELVPPLDPKFEQRSHWNVVGEKRFLGRVWIATGPAPKPLNTSRLDASQFEGGLDVQWGVPFMVKAPRQRTFLNGGMTHLDMLSQDRLWFPGGLYFDVPAGAGAVYIGTLRFHRNDFNTITRIEVVDQREDIAAVLRTGSGADVQPSLLKRSR